MFDTWLLNVIRILSRLIKLYKKSNRFASCPGLMTRNASKSFCSQQVEQEQVRVASTLLKATRVYGGWRTFVTGFDQGKMSMQAASRGSREWSPLQEAIAINAYVSRSHRDLNDR